MARLPITWSVSKATYGTLDLEVLMPTTHSHAVRPAGKSAVNRPTNCHLTIKASIRPLVSGTARSATVPMALNVMVAHVVTVMSPPPGFERLMTHVYMSD